tara:strand:- start:1301 stop:1408 length:108 start_codon:yes stop_codon:yes gene_type:complete
MDNLSGGWVKENGFENGVGGRGEWGSTLTLYLQYI